MKTINWDKAEGSVPFFVNVLRVRITSEDTVILDLGYIDSEVTPTPEDTPTLVTKVVMPLSLYKKIRTPGDPDPNPTGKVWFN